ncbi:MAG: hypothetical protein AAGA64_03535 [Bacteroidota bacterium]
MRNVEWAAGLDDRLENTDYRYNKKRLWKSTGGYFTWASVFITLKWCITIRTRKVFVPRLKLKITPVLKNAPG